jgi:hypothetical protein
MSLDPHVEPGPDAGPVVLGGMTTTVFRMSTPERAAEARARIGAFAEINGGRAYEPDDHGLGAQLVLAIDHDDADESLLRDGVLTIDPEAKVISPTQDDVSAE